MDAPIVWHAGAITGYHTTFIAAPEAGWAIAVQQNVYSPLRDEALNSPAFGALAIALGGTPDPNPGSSLETTVLVALGLLALVLVGALAWNTYRLVRRRSAWPPTWRGWLATVGWLALGILSAVTVGLLLPGMYDLELRHVMRFMPDVGQLAYAILVLGAALVVVRLAALVVHARRAAGGQSEG